MTLENLPVICPGKTRLAGVADDQATLEFRFIDPQRFPFNTVGTKMEAGSGTILRRIIILETGGHSNHCGLNISGDSDELSLIVTIPNESIERSNTGYGER